MSTSQNGWPALGSDSSKLHTWIIPTKTGEVRIRMRNGSAGLILAHWAKRYAETIQPVHGKLLDDWGYAYRPVRGFSRTLSNHSSGTAIDLNATRHPLGRVGRFLSWQDSAIRREMRSRLYAGSLRAGLMYSGRKDPMHFEINCSLSQAEKVARRLADTPRGKAILAANPGQRQVIFS